MKNQVKLDERLEKLIKEKYSSSFMSNSKWVKLIQLLVDNYQLIKLCQIKLVYEDKIRQLTIDGDELYDFDFHSQSMEGMVTHSIIPGWTLYKEIEWIGFPKYLEDNLEIKQDITKIKQCIDNLGKFNDELSTEYYRIYAYK